MRGYTTPPAVIEEARVMYLAGESSARIAVACQVDRTTVLSWRRRYGWPRQKPYPDRVAQRRYVNCRGKPYARAVVMSARALWGRVPAYRIAFQLDLDRETVTRWAKHYAWGPGYPKRGPVPYRGPTPKPDAVPLPVQAEARWRCDCQRVVVGLICPSCGTKAAWAA